MQEGNVKVPSGMTLKEYWKDLIEGFGVILTDSEDDSSDSDCIIVAHQKGEVCEEEMPPMDVSYSELPTVSEVTMPQIMYIWYYTKLCS